jgi:hypothetical protein
MRILVEILHPAHVHFFRHFIAEMESRGHQLLVTSRDKDVALALLDAYRIPHRMLSAQKKGALGLAGELLNRTRALLPMIDAFRPDVLTGIMGPTIALAGRWKRVPTVVFYDTETAWLTNSWVYRLADAVCTPDSVPGTVPGRPHTPGITIWPISSGAFTPSRTNSALRPRSDRPFTLARSSRSRPVTMWVTGASPLRARSRCSSTSRSTVTWWCPLKDRCPRGFRPNH